MTTVGLPNTSTYTTIDPYHAWSHHRPVPTDQKVGVRIPSGAPFSSTRQPLRFAGAEPPRTLTGRRVSAVSPLIVRTPLGSGRHHQRRSMTDAVPAAALLATTVCLAGSTVTAWVEITVCAPVLVSMAITGVVERLAT
jgi:hypothetical protein